MKSINVFWRSTSYRLGQVTNDYEDAMDLVEDFIWDNGVFETDGDPLWVFTEGELSFVLRLAHTHRGYVSDGIGGGKCEETRVVNMFDEKAQWMNVVTLQHEREIEEGEID